MKLHTTKLRLHQLQQLYGAIMANNSQGLIDDQKLSVATQIGAFIKYQKDILTLAPVTSELDGPYASGETQMLNPNFRAHAIQYLDGVIEDLHKKDDYLWDTKHADSTKVGPINSYATLQAHTIGTKIDTAVSLKQEIKKADSPLEALVIYRNDLL